MDVRLIKACQGKTASQGGMNVPELLQIAKESGYMGGTNRAEIIAFLSPNTTGTKVSKVPILARLCRR